MTTITITNGYSVQKSVEGGIKNTEQSKKLGIDNYSNSVAEGNAGQVKNRAVVIDTEALFVRTPDGVVHSKDGDHYVPEITNASYMRKVK